MDQTPEHSAPLLSLPGTEVASASCKLDQRDSSRAIAARLRILHPDAVAIYPTLHVGKFQSYILEKYTRHHPDCVPLLVLNPDELTPGKLREVIASGASKRHYLATAKPFEPYYPTVHELERHYDEAIEELLETQDTILDKCRREVKDSHDYYPPNPRLMEELMAGEAPIPAVYKYLKGWPLRDWKEKNERAREDKVKRMNSVLKEGSAPPLDASEREKIERFIRDRLSEFNPDMLYVLQDSGAYVWAADMMYFTDRALVMGQHGHATNTVSSLFDEPTVMFEEIFHLVDDRFQASANPYFIKMVHETDAPRRDSEASRHFVDDAIRRLVFPKSGVFDPESTYADCGPKGKAAEFLVNLAHLERLKLTPERREVLGELLHRHFNDRYPSIEPYEDTMWELLHDICPHTMPTLDRFHRELHTHVREAHDNVQPRATGHEDTRCRKPCGDIER